ncbi:acyl--CoA ligase [Micromonospora sp. PSH03]|uniref:class I adenylate-forming enzyme family protein n=1 Tax=Micromonospora salmantinae TaxID=2911211 RepID=UPI001EE8EB35|nr:class I adenylate-forming enzyme family protein [Micromonospora salmantinae]MCG5455400.1 acyl--CoA ligase [Micromonospora salmantinae]
MLHEAFQEVVRTRRAAVAVQAVDGEEFTYAQLSDLVERASTGLLGVGVQPGHHVATRLHNGPAYIAIILALARLGAVHLPISVQANRDRLRWSLAQVPVQLLIHEQPDDLLNTPVDSLGVDALFAGSAPRAVESLPVGSRSGVFRLLETTGSTGVPKLVAWRQEDLLADRRQWLSYLKVTSEDVFLTMHPLDVAHGVDVHMFPALLAGARLVLSDPAAPPDRLLSTLAESGTTIFSALPRHYQLLADTGSTALPSLRLPLCGGAYLSPEVITQARRHLGVQIRRIYGSTEFGIVLGNLDDVAQESRGMHPLPAVEVTLEPLSAQMPALGEILARSPHTSIGYEGNPVETARAFRAGWYRTGDVGEQTESGEYRVLGRVADVLTTTSGRLIFAPQLEGTLQADAAVGEAAVLPSSRGDGSAPLVVVTPADGASVRNVAAAVRRLLGEHGLADRVQVVDELPHTPVGKLDKPAILRRWG